MDMNTPMNNLSNINENLIQSENNIQQNENNNHYLVETKDQSFESNTFIIEKTKCNRICVSILIIIILLSSLIPAIVFYELELNIRIFIISFGIILSLLILFCLVNKIVIIKDISNKKVLIKLMNYLFFAKTKLNLEIENTHFYSDNIFGFLIINDYKNLVGIDLDESNIKRKPAKFIYSFSSINFGNYNQEKFIKVLNEFIGASIKYKNPLFFNIHNYLKDKKDKFYSSTKLQKYMKFSEHFFTYHLRYPFSHSIALLIIITMTIFVDIFLIISLLCSLSEEYDFINKKNLMISILIFNLTMYIIYKFIIICFDNIGRIDCIYSKNFDRIFIGVVKYTNSKYLKTAEFQINNISKFIFERDVKFSNVYFNLNAVFKNGEKQKIFTLSNINQGKIEGLIYLLNERLINNDDSN